MLFEFMVYAFLAVLFPVLTVYAVLLLVAPENVFELPLWFFLGIAIVVPVVSKESLIICLIALYVACSTGRKFFVVAILLVHLFASMFLLYWRSDSIGF